MMKIIAFVEWLTSGRCQVLYPSETIVSGSEQCQSRTQSKNDSIQTLQVPKKSLKIGQKEKSCTFSCDNWLFHFHILM